MLIGSHDEAQVGRDAERVVPDFGVDRSGRCPVGNRRRFGTRSGQHRRHDGVDEIERGGSVVEPSVWQAPAGSGGGQIVARRLVERSSCRAVADDERALVDMAELQAEQIEVDRLAGDRGFDLGAAGRIGEHVGHDPAVLRWIVGESERDRHLGQLERVVERLIAVELSDRSTLGLVGVEDRGIGPAGFHRSDLPHEIVHVGNTGVQPEPSGRREPMSRVPDEEGPAAAVGLGDLRAHVPVRDPEHLEVGGGVGQRCTDESAAARFGEGLHRFGFGVPAVHEHPLPIGAVIHERAARRRVDEEVEHAPRVADERSEVSTEMHHHERLDGPRSGQLDTERAPHAAPPAVGREQVARLDAVLPLRPVDHDAHPVGLLDHRRPRVAVADIEVCRQQQRFEPVLAEVADRCRGDRQHLVALTLERQGPDDLAAELGDPVDVACFLG